MYILYNTVYTRIKGSYQSLLTGTVDGCGTRYLQERLKTYQDYCKWTDENKHGGTKQINICWWPIPREICIWWLCTYNMWYTYILNIYSDIIIHTCVWHIYDIYHTMYSILYTSKYYIHLYTIYIYILYFIHIYIYPDQQDPRNHMVYRQTRQKTRVLLVRVYIYNRYLYIDIIACSSLMSLDPGGRPRTWGDSAGQVGETHGDTGIPRLKWRLENGKSQENPM